MNISEFKKHWHWNITYSQESDSWMGISEILGLTLSGKSKNELINIISEGVDLLIEDLKEDGELE